METSFISFIILFMACALRVINATENWVLVQTYPTDSAPGVHTLYTLLSPVTTASVRIDFPANPAFMHGFSRLVGLVVMSADGIGERVIVMVQGF